MAEATNRLMDSTACNAYSTSPVLMVILAYVFIVLALIIKNQHKRRAVAVALVTLFIPFVVIVAAGPWMIGFFIGHQAQYPGSESVLPAFILAWFTLSSTIVSPLIGWQWAMHHESAIRPRFSLLISRLACLRNLIINRPFRFTAFAVLLILGIAGIVSGYTSHFTFTNPDIGPGGWSFWFWFYGGISIFIVGVSGMIGTSMIEYRSSPFGSRRER